jgi:hypothetical protein
VGTHPSSKHLSDGRGSGLKDDVGMAPTCQNIAFFNKSGSKSEMPQTTLNKTNNIMGLERVNACLSAVCNIFMRDFV